MNECIRICQYLQIWKHKTHETSANAVLFVHTFFFVIDYKILQQTRL